MGLVWDVAPGMNLYAQYATAADPPAGVLSTATFANVRDNTELTTGRSYEVGSKLDFWGGKGTATVAAAWVSWSRVPAWGLAPEPSVAQFMQVSSLLVNHRLDAEVGARMAAVATVKYPQYAGLMTAITRAAQTRQAVLVEDFFDDLPAGPVREFALWIIFAWYTGCDSPKKDATVFAYETALTYQTTADAVAIPSYGFSGPNQWARPIVPLSPLPVF